MTATLLDSEHFKKFKNTVKDSIKNVKSDIESVNAKIPSQASSTNQLADKEFVNSSISTATATFRGLVSSLDELKALSGDLNDYAIVKTTDSKGNITQYDRYKYSSTVSSETGNWLLEYTLNNSTFTDAQWKALNSGVTEESLAQIITNKDLIAALSKKLTEEITNRKTTDENLANHIADTNNPHKVTKSQIGLGNVDNTSDASLFTDISNTNTNLSLTIGGTTKSISNINAKSAITDGNGNNIVNTYALKSDITSIDSNYVDNAEKTVNITLENNTDVSLTNSPYTINITIPNTTTHGFRSIIQFENKTDIAQVNVTNNSAYNLLTMQNGDIVTSKMQYSTNEIVRLYFDCDGLYTYMYIQEIYK